MKIDNQTDHQLKRLRKAVNEITFLLAEPESLLNCIDAKKAAKAYQKFLVIVERQRLHVQNGTCSDQAGASYVSAQVDDVNKSLAKLKS